MRTSQHDKRRKNCSLWGVKFKFCYLFINIHSHHTQTWWQFRCNYILNAEHILNYHSRRVCIDVVSSSSSSSTDMVWMCPSLFIWGWWCILNIWLAHLAAIHSPLLPHVNWKTNFCIAYKLIAIHLMSKCAWKHFHTFRLPWSWFSI